MNEITSRLHWVLTINYIPDASKEIGWPFPTLKDEIVAQVPSAVVTEHHLPKLKRIVVRTATSAASHKADMIARSRLMKAGVEYGTAERVASEVSPEGSGVFL